MDVLGFRDWFYNHVTIGGKRYKLDDEQIAVILDEHKNTIVQARAGSGKTTTIIAKIIYLVTKKGVDPKRILALGFNSEPQQKMDEKLRSVRVDGKLILDSEDIAMTFHKFAKRMGGKGDNVLVDNPEKKTNDRTDYIRKIIDKVVGKKLIYDFVRDDSYEPREDKYETHEEYLLAKHYFRYETLSGTLVASRGEKTIADYLFEHGIDFQYEGMFIKPQKLAKYATDSESYERLSRYKKEKIVPDFFLPDYGLVWEHWAIHGDESFDEQEDINDSGAIGSYDDYLETKEFKEWFYSGSWLDSEAISTEEAEEDNYLQSFLRIKGFIWTYYEKDRSREVFEKELDELMSRKQIPHTKLPDEELLEKFHKNPEIVSKNDDRICSFIDRAEQIFPGDYEELERQCNRITEKQTSLFYKSALAVYKYYLDELLSDPTTYRGIIDEEPFRNKHYSIDFSLLMDKASKFLRSDGADFSQVKELEYLFLDEFQDFSLLFLNLVKAIQFQAPNIKILAVGDDWQAINSYTGASLEYFREFEKYFPEDSHRMAMRTNYRSVFSIVEAANRFMENALSDYSGAVACRGDNEGENALNDITINSIKHQSGSGKRSSGHLKYDIALSEIVRDNIGKSILILNRTDKVKLDEYDTKSINEYMKMFKERFKDHFNRRCKYNIEDESKFNCMTIHKAKGLESDVVVILEGDCGRIPMFHSDNYLYEVFGVTEAKALEEQKYLFYVDITRAKDKVYILHKKDLLDGGPEERPDRDFLSMAEVKEGFNHFEKKSFHYLEDQILKDETKEFLATKIDFDDRKYFQRDKVDITVTAKNGEKVKCFGVFSDYENVKALRNIQWKCSERTPQKIRASHTNNPRYKKQFIILSPAV